MARRADWAGRTVVDRRGERIGEIDFLYVDESGRPEWAGVLNVHLLGMRPALVPLRRASVEGREVRLRHTRDQVRSAPYVSPDQELSDEDEALLLRHYRLPRGVSRRPGPPRPPRSPGGVATRGEPFRDG
jgi:hypothetical protein